MVHANLTVGVNVSVSVNGYMLSCWGLGEFFVVCGETRQTTPAIGSSSPYSS